MKPDEYIELAMRTETTRKPYLSVLQFRMLHAAMGMVDESSEFLKQMKSNAFYGTKLDMTNIKEELGDTLWFVGQAIDTLRAFGEDVSFESIMEKNIAKLEERYPDKFTEENALDRDLDAEREVLEK